MGTLGDGMFKSRLKLTQFTFKILHWPAERATNSLTSLSKTVIRQRPLDFAGLSHPLTRQTQPGTNIQVYIVPLKLMLKGIRYLTIGYENLSQGFTRSHPQHLQIYTFVTLRFTP